MSTTKRDRERGAGDSRDLRRPETLLGADAFETVLGRLPAGAKILDLGGVSSAIVDIARRGFAVHVENIPLPGAESRVPEDFRPELAAADSSQAAVLAPGVCFFLPKPAARRLIAEIERALQPGGVGFIAFPPLWNPRLDGEALIDAATPDGPDADIVRRGAVSVRFTRYTSREIEKLAEGFSTQHLVTQKNGVRRLVFRKKS